MATSHIRHKGGIAPSQIEDFPMLYFGSFWDEFVSHKAQQEIWSWYGPYGYPQRLRHEVMQSPIVLSDEHTTPLDPRAYDRLLRQVKDYARSSVARYKLAYHNEQHFAEVAQAATYLFDQLHGRAARSPKLLVVRQMIEIAAWLHDCHHRGCTLRHDSVHPLPLPHLGKNVSVEFVSASQANDLLAGIGLPLVWRVLIANLILATSFGGTQAQQRGISGIPVVGGHATTYHALIHVADIWPPRDEFAAAKQAVDVNLHEIPASGQKIHDPQELMQAQISFENYRIGEMRNLDRICGKSITRIGQQHCEKNVRAYTAALAGKNPKLAAHVLQLMA